MPGFPFFLFLLWELPSMILMSLHKLWCAVTGGSLQESFRGIWFYRVVGMFVVWTSVMLLIGLAGSGGASAGLVAAIVPVASFVTVDQLLAAAPRAELWRYRAADYTRYHERLVDRDALGDVAAVADEVWQLRDVHRRHGAALHEEAILATLLADLTADTQRC